MSFMSELHMFVAERNKWKYSNLLYVVLTTQCQQHVNTVKVFLAAMSPLILTRATQTAVKAVCLLKDKIASLQDHLSRALLQETRMYVAEL